VQDGDLILHPSMVRLLRRMIRDSIFRDRAPQTTIQFYDSVERGEEKYIMPYKYRSTYDVDTFIDYELSVIKTLLPELANLPDAEKQKAAPLLQVLEDIAPIDPAWVPKNALLREFIGDTL
jgi:uridine kinase